MRDPKELKDVTNAVILQLPSSTAAESMSSIILYPVVFDGQKIVASRRWTTPEGERVEQFIVSGDMFPPVETMDDLITLTDEEFTNLELIRRGYPEDVC